MKLTYDVETDILRIRLNQKRIGESNELIPGTIVDVDIKGQAVSFEVLDASKQMENPAAIAFEVVMSEMTKKKPRGAAV
jgi:uncharacterized protein YuzE